ncbi:hypothetical protein DMC30DRAFT_148997 [Rhodotorula diobovata]|uniref:Uncharacterized protein n=1 Tax=Rhodotorula diobovata TaxID=5288 RepID=A0A5C5FZX8_9BASI|nr:hypothetical protein DMC30DRAFT_148997 [Rhodotorula diobovata]
MRALVRPRRDKVALEQRMPPPPGRVGPDVGLEGDQVALPPRRGPVVRRARLGVVRLGGRGADGDARGVGEGVGGRGGDEVVPEGRGDDVGLEHGGVRDRDVGRGRLCHEVGVVGAHVLVADLDPCGGWQQGVGQDSGSRGGRGRGAGGAPSFLASAACCLFFSADAAAKHRLTGTQVKLRPRARVRVIRGNVAPGREGVEGDAREPEALVLLPQRVAVADLAALLGVEVDVVSVCTGERQLLVAEDDVEGVGLAVVLGGRVPVVGAARVKADEAFLGDCEVGDAEVVRPRAGGRPWPWLAWLGGCADTACAADAVEAVGAEVVL